MDGGQRERSGFQSASRTPRQGGLVVGRTRCGGAGRQAHALGTELGRYRQEWGGVPAWLLGAGGLVRLRSGRSRKT